MPVSERKLRANRLNAQQSTGPKSKAGKDRSSKNASTHLLFSPDLLLPSEDETLFLSLRNSLLHTLSPQNLLELSIVDELVAAKWKLLRLQSAESAVHVHLDSTIKARRPKKPDQDYPDPIPAYVTTAWALLDKDHRALDRLARHEQRLQRTVNRCLKQLFSLRKSLGDAPPPSCPYLLDPDNHLNPFTRAPESPSHEPLADDDNDDDGDGDDESTVDNTDTEDLTPNHAPPPPPRTPDITQIVEIEPTDPAPSLQNPHSPESKPTEPTAESCSPLVDPRLSLSSSPLSPCHPLTLSPCHPQTQTHSPPSHQSMD
jgi:hypothetical protein